MAAAKPPEFRRRALQLVSEGIPVAQVAKELGVSESGVRRWLAQDDSSSGREDGPINAESKELVELRRQCRMLEIEVKFLQQATAYFARESVLRRR